MFILIFFFIKGRLKLTVIFFLLVMITLLSLMTRQ